MKFLLKLFNLLCSKCIYTCILPMPIPLHGHAGLQFEHNLYCHKGRQDILEYSVVSQNHHRILHITSQREIYTYIDTDRHLHAHIWISFVPWRSKQKTEGYVAIFSYITPCSVTLTKKKITLPCGVGIFLQFGWWRRDFARPTVCYITCFSILDCPLLP